MRKKKTIFLTKEQLDRLVEGDSVYLTGSNYNEFPDNEVSATSNTDDGPGKPVTTDKISKSLSRSNDSFGFTRQVVPGNYTTESKTNWENKHKLNEVNQDLINRQFNIGTADVPHYVSYTNLTTIKNELEQERNRMGKQFPQQKQEELDKINSIYSNAKANSQNIRDNKVKRGERVRKEHTKQKNNGIPKNGEPIITYEN